MSRGEEHLPPGPQPVPTSVSFPDPETQVLQEHTSARPCQAPHSHLPSPLCPVSSVPSGRTWRRSWGWGCVGIQPCLQGRLGVRTVLPPGLHTRPVAASHSRTCQRAGHGTVFPTSSQNHLCEWSHEPQLKNVTQILIVMWLYLVLQIVQNLCRAETWIWFLGQEDLLEKAMATHSSILARKIP